MNNSQLIAAIQEYINARGGMLHAQQVPDLVNAILPEPEPEPENPGEEIETLVVTPPADTPVPPAPAPAPEGDAAL